MPRTVAPKSQLASSISPGRTVTLRDKREKTPEQTSPVKRAARKKSELQTTPIVNGEHLSPVAKLTKDIRDAAVTLSDQEARFLVSLYYQLQDQRIRAAGQVRAMGDTPHQTLAFFEDQSSTLEQQIKRSLDAYSLSTPVGRWLRSICGIGPVIAAGLMAHVDVANSPTAGHLWAYAGLDPSKTWEKGKKRPWNAELKTLCWKAGESFVKVQSRDSDFYGKLYARRKLYEKEKNDRGEYAELAKQILAKKKFGDDTLARAAYEAGRLPDGHIHARAKRWAVKIFLSHFHYVAWKEKFGSEPPKPYAIAILQHAHYLAVPYYDDENGE